LKTERAMAAEGQVVSHRPDLAIYRGPILWFASV